MSTNAEPSPPIPSIRMGQMEVARGNQALKTLLGSCIGLALYCLRSQVGGLAHIVLPDSRGETNTPGKYVNTAIPELIRQLERAGAKEAGLRAKLAGGANMLDAGAAETIGEQNHRSVRHELELRGIKVVAEHCGGAQGRRMTLYPATGRVLIQIVGCEDVEI